MLTLKEVRALKFYTTQTYRGNVQNKCKKLFLQWLNFRACNSHQRCKIIKN